MPKTKNELIATAKSTLLLAVAALRDGDIAQTKRALELTARALKPIKAARGAR